jgi:DNA-binding NtrC family response regulator
MLEDDIWLAAQVKAPALITAGTRDQREVCARLVHAIGRDCRGPFVSVRCEAGELAGDSRASHRRIDGEDASMLRSHHELARGGTLFIDEVAALPADAQAQLLAMLGDRPSSESSAARFQSTNVRVIAGASHHLDAELLAGVFCDRLFYRLNLVHVDFVGPTYSEWPIP